MKRYPLMSLFALSILLISCGESQTQAQEAVEDVPVHTRLVAVINPTDGNEASGVITFSREGEDVRVIATISGLDPESQHGFHIHEYGDCSASDGTSAGGHYDPYGMPHGAPTDSERHIGDMGNITTDGDGVGTLEYVDSHIELDGMYSILGRGVIVHAGEDDLQTQPTGDAGGRLGCGTIGVAQPLE